jgi:hypothetical protein
MIGLRVLSGDMPRLDSGFFWGSSIFMPLEVDTAGWRSCCGRELTLFVLLLPPPGLNRELLLLLWDFGEKFGFKE